MNLDSNVNFRTQIDGVNVINGHLALFGPYYVGIVDNVKLKYMSTKRMKPTQLLDLSEKKMYNHFQVQNSEHIRNIYEKLGCAV